MNLEKIKKITWHNRPQWDGRKSQQTIRKITNQYAKLWKKKLTDNWSQDGLSILLSMFWLLANCSLIPLYYCDDNFLWDSPTNCWQGFCQPQNPWLKKKKWNMMASSNANISQIPESMIFEEGSTAKNKIDVLYYKTLKLYKVCGNLIENTYIKYIKNAITSLNYLRNTNIWPGQHDDNSIINEVAHWISWYLITNYQACDGCKPEFSKWLKNLQIEKRWISMEELNKHQST